MTHDTDDSLMEHIRALQKARIESVLILQQLWRIVNQYPGPVPPTMAHQMRRIADDVRLFSHELEQYRIYSLPTSYATMP